MPSINYNNEILVSSPEKPISVKDQSWLDVNTPKTIWVYGEKRSGKGVVIDFIADAFRKAGFGLVFHCYSADGFENCYYAYNNNCGVKWESWRRNTESELRDVISYLKSKYVDEITSSHMIELDDLVFGIYQYKKKASEYDSNKMVDMLKLYNSLKNEGLHCKCWKPVPIILMIPEYGNIEQYELDAYNGVSWKNYDEYYNAYMTGVVDDFIPNETWVDVRKIRKPSKFQPKKELIKIHKFTLPMDASGIQDFRIQFRDVVNKARIEHRVLVNTQSCYPTDKRGKLEKYTTLAEIFKYLPELSQMDFAQLHLDKPREEWTVYEKSWHKIGIIANEVREFAPSAKLSGDDEARVSKKAFFNFVPKIRHHKSWFAGDLQSPADLEIGVRIQDDFQIIKRNTEKRLGVELADFYQTIEKESDKMLLQYSGEDFIDNVGSDIIDFVSSFHPRIPVIPDNKCYILFGNGEYILRTINMQSWHHKSDRDDWADQTGIHYYIEKERKAVEDKSLTSGEERKPKKSKAEKEEQWVLIEDMREHKNMSWNEIIEHFVKRDEDNGIKDSKWKTKNPKTLSNLYAYHKQAEAKREINKSV